VTATEDELTTTGVELAAMELEETARDDEAATELAEDSIAEELNDEDAAGAELAGYSMLELAEECTETDDDGTE
jgi:hypothetical protein